MSLTIKSNRHTRPLHTIHDIPEPERADFEYITEEEQWDARFFHYRGSWYDYHEFEFAPDTYRALGWDGIQTESYFSAVVVTYFTRDGYELDGEIIVGYAHW